jgi:hypothetical protein
MLNWDDEITAITGAEARMLRVSVDRIQAIVDDLQVQAILQDPFASAKEVRERLARMYEVLVAEDEDLVCLSYRDSQRLAVILRRWTSERRVRSFNDGLIGGLSSFIRHATRSAAANMRLVAPIGAPPRLA